jgi:hypothetical protein
MASIDFPVSSTPGRLPGEGEGRLINCYIEKGGNSVYWRRAVGSTSFASTGQSGPRGLIDVNGVVYAAYPSATAIVQPDGSVSVVSGLPGAGGVTWARNNKPGTPDVVAAREGGGPYVVTTAGASAYPDADLPANANSVASLGGFLLFTVPDGRIFASDLNNTAMNALSFATAESQPDGLLRGIVHAGVFYAMGTSTIEPWLNVGSSPFPLLRATSVMPVGLLTTMAVAGFEEGWDHNPFFVAHDRTVRELTGYTTAVVSTADVEAFIARSTITKLEASVFTVRGHSIWCLSSDVGTWHYDVSTKSWHERVSLGLDRWRSSRSVKSNGRWLTGDRQSGSLLAIDDAVFTEAGSSIPWTAESADLKNYPDRIAIPAAFFDFSPTGEATVSISWSRDGGERWSTPITRSMKPSGRAKYPVRVSGLGLASHRGIRFRLTCSDNVEFSLMGGSVPDPQKRLP